jgi:hypothetical protein
MDHIGNSSNDYQDLVKAIPKSANYDELIEKDFEK